jgi:GT2 family glycosyltransferase
MTRRTNSHRPAVRDLPRIIDGVDAGPADPHCGTPCVTAVVSVVICAYTERRWKDLCTAVRSVLDQMPPALEVIVVVDHNDDLLTRASCEWPTAAAERDPVRVVASREAPGLSGARNTGVAAAHGLIVAFLDDDAVARSGWLASLCAVLAGPDVVAAGGGVKAISDRPIPAWWPHEFDWVVGCSWRGLPETNADVRNVIGCNMAFWRDDLHAIGGFSSDIGRIAGGGAGDEETDLCIRLHQRSPQARVVYVPAAVVDHRVPASRYTWTYFRRRCFGEGRSKAVVAERNGADRALAAERAYTLRILPRGVADGLTDAGRGRLGGLARAAAIVFGLTFTVAGYASGRVAARPHTGSVP